MCGKFISSHQRKYSDANVLRQGDFSRGDQEVLPLQVMFAKICITWVSDIPNKTESKPDLAWRKGPIA